MKLGKLGLLLLCFVLIVAAAAAMLAIPPYNSRSLTRIHSFIYDRTGIVIHYLDHYSGPIRCWDAEGNLRSSYTLVNGEYDGVYVEYDTAGAVVRKCTYRQGEPWDGVCQIYPRKAFLGEYKAGKPWNGRIPWRNPATGKYETVNFRDGVPVSDQTGSENP